MESENTVPRKRRSFTLIEVQKLAADNGGKCLAKKYVNSTYKMLFECAAGHKWKANTLDVFGKKSRKGKWCAQCGTSPKEK